MSRADADEPGASDHAGIDPGARPGALAGVLAPGERVRRLFRPSLAFVPLRTWKSVVLVGLVSASLHVGLRRIDPGGSALALWTGAGVVLVRVLWSAFDRAVRAYAITDRRLLAVVGIFRRTAMDLPLARVQHVIVDATLGERIFGAGSVIVSSAGGDGIDLVWLHVDRPGEIVGVVREAADQARLGNPARARPVVIGLTGGIGAGKSEVARLLADRGFLVSDSDAEGRAALEREDVREKLTAWWGNEVLDEGGRVSRAKVAGVVFDSPEQRARLEGLVHPIIREARERVIERAGRSGAPGVVVDAPLLVEAGLDKECDLVVFVDAPRPLRLERVRSSRGWDEAELSRREAAQWPLEAKRARAHRTVENRGDREGLSREVDALVLAARELGNRVDPAGGSGV